MPTWLLVASLAGVQLALVGLVVGAVAAFNAIRATSKRADHLLAVLDVLDESLVVCCGLEIVMANESFRRLAGRDELEIRGILLSDLVADPNAVDLLVADEPARVECHLNCAGNSKLLVEIAATSLTSDGVQQRILEITNIAERKHDAERIAFLAHHDSLTGLPNRATMGESLERLCREAREHSTKLALIWIDLDRFKEVNDGYGHAVGDQVLKSVAERLRSDLPDRAVASRFGGDEFVVIYPDIPDRLEARLLGQHLRLVLNQPVTVGGRSYDVGASIGIGVFPDDGENPETLLVNADLALYDAKNTGRGRHRHFSPDLRRTADLRRHLSTELPNMIARDELTTWFQPIIHSDTGRIRGFEALARWEHPELGSIPPSDFIRIAEETNQIEPLTRSVIRSAIEAARAWPDEVRFAVNVTARQIYSDFVDYLADLLQETRFPPHRLEIEVTEDTIIADFQQCASMFSRLRAMGVQIAMDDFGAGYTSIGNLSRLNFNKIKLDKLLTDQLPHHRRSRAIVTGLMTMARNLDIAVTVEGIESKPQADFFQGRDCFLQGYYFGRPVPAEQLAELRRFLPGPTLVPAAISRRPEAASDRALPD
ncbi:MAG TPA: EAL domain-containing protein [Afifellaceae bacterium]|nr:EAL domain-containing protein [Afifellaceae bacterium]